MSSYKISTVSPPMILGEGPIWIEEDQALMFVDHPGRTLNRVFPESGRHQVLELDGCEESFGPSVIIPIEDSKNGYLVGLGHDLVYVNWSTTDNDRIRLTPKTVLSFEEDLPKNGLNDAKCDPYGTLWAGTKGHESASGYIEPKKGNLYKIDKSFQVSKMLDEITISNGLTWSLDAEIFYHIDSAKQKIDAYDFCRNSGEIANKRVVFDFVANGLADNYPDGMTIDNNGNLWIACYNGAKVINVSTVTGTMIEKIDIPSRYTTSCCFGGPDYSTLFVTSATRNLSEEEIRSKPDSGKTFAVTNLGVKGFQHHSFKADLKILNEKLM